MQLENLTITQLLDRAVKKDPGSPALMYRDQLLSYEALQTLSERYAMALRRRGVKKGDHVAILCEAEPATVIAIYAIARLGAVTVMLNTSLLRRELAIRLEKADVKYLLIGDGYKDLTYAALCASLTGEVPGLQQILYMGQNGCKQFDSLLEDVLRMKSGDPVADEASPEDTAFILFTSGTDSTPKAVMTSHFSRVNSGIQQAADLQATADDRFCTAMPLFHCFSLSVNLFAACAVGACLYLPVSRGTEDLLHGVEDGKCSVFSCVPALYRAILRRLRQGSWDISSLRVGFIGGSSYPQALFVQVEKELGMTLLSSLGQTEATAGITAAAMDDPLMVRAATVGRFMNHVQGRIADPYSNESLPTGKIGEICVRGYVVMQGYYKQEKDTARVIDSEGWLHTGDVGRMDPDGYVYLHGRMKELIIRGGENISPGEIEAVLFDDDRVLSCKAVGIPDQHYGEEVCLCIVPNPKLPCREKDIRTHLSERLAAYKVPKYILFLQDLPVTATGKIRTSALQELASQAIKRKINNDYAQQGEYDGIYS